jgi:hypothetical protein
MSFDHVDIVHNVSTEDVARANPMKRSPREPVTFDTLRALALALPGVEDGMSYGTPALKVKGKLMVRLKEDGQSVVLVIGFDNREILMQANPETFYITDHYRNYPSVLMKLSRVSAEELRTVLELTWRNVAPKKWLRTGVIGDRGRKSEG